MKLLTLNTHSWQEDDQLEKLDILATAIIDHRFDVIALQEVNQLMASPKLCKKFIGNAEIAEDNYAYLLQQLLAKHGHHYELTWDYVHQSYGKYQEGLAFLTKASVLAHQTIDLNENYDEGFWKHRRAVKISIAHKEQVIDLFNCHCGWWDDEEAPFQAQIAKIMQQLSDRPSFLLGDFNNPSQVKNQGYNYLLEQGLVDTYNISQNKDAGFSVVKKIDGWKENNKKLRIDLILTNQTHKVLQSRTMFNGSNYPVVSDHFGVMTQLELTAQENQLSEDAEELVSFGVI